MPGFYPEGVYDLAGFAVGVVDKDRVITGERVQAGDALIGLRSSGVHSNGYSLVWKILEVLAPLSIRGCMCSNVVKAGLARMGVEKFESVFTKKLQANGMSVHDPCPWESDVPIGKVLLQPTYLYVQPVLKLLQKFDVRAMCHITGGGLLENLPRIVNKTRTRNKQKALYKLGFEIRKGTWEIPKVFKWLQRAGEVEESEMYRTFNMGIGFCLVVP